MHGSLMYREKRLAGYDAATVVEVIEHLDAHRLAAFERVLFESARPKTIIVTTLLAKSEHDQEVHFRPVRDFSDKTDSPAHKHLFLGGTSRIRNPSLSMVCSYWGEEVFGQGLARRISKFLEASKCRKIQISYCLRNDACSIQFR